MAELPIPTGYGVPLVDLTTSMLPTPTMDVLRADAESNGMVRGTAGKKYRTVACAIRNSGAGFELIDDVGHSPLGVTGITNDTVNNNIILNYDFVAKTVGSLVVTPDETFSLRGYQIGASVGFSTATIQVGVTGIWSDYIYWDVETLAFKSFNNQAASILPSTNVTLAGWGQYVYKFNAPISYVGPLYGGSMSSRTSDYVAHLEGYGPAVGGEFGGFNFRFADAATRVAAPAMVDGSDGRATMKAWVTLNSPMVHKVPIADMVSTSGNFWIHGVFEVD